MPLAAEGAVLGGAVHQQPRTSDLDLARQQVAAGDAAVVADEAVAPDTRQPDGAVVVREAVAPRPRGPGVVHVEPLPVRDRGAERPDVAGVPASLLTARQERLSVARPVPVHAVRAGGELDPGVPGAVARLHAQVAQVLRAVRLHGHVVEEHLFLVICSVRHQYLPRRVPGLQVGTDVDADAGAHVLHRAGAADAGDTGLRAAGPLLARADAAGQGQRPATAQRAADESLELLGGRAREGAAAHDPVLEALVPVEVVLAVQRRMQRVALVDAPVDAVVAEGQADRVLDRVVVEVGLRVFAVGDVLVHAHEAAAVGHRRRRPGDRELLAPFAAGQHDVGALEAAVGEAVGQRLAPVHAVVALRVGHQVGTVLVGRLGNAGEPLGPDAGAGQHVPHAEQVLLFVVEDVGAGRGPLPRQVGHQHRIVRMADRLVLDTRRVPAVLDGEVVQEQVQVVSGIVGRAAKVGGNHGSSSPPVGCGHVRRLDAASPTAQPERGMYRLIGCSHVLTGHLSRRSRAVPCDPLRAGLLQGHPPGGLRVRRQDALPARVGAGALRLLHPPAALRQDLLAVDAGELLRPQSGGRFRPGVRRPGHRPAADLEPRSLRGRALQLLHLRQRSGQTGTGVRRVLPQARPGRRGGPSRPLQRCGVRPHPGPSHHQRPTRRVVPARPARGDSALRPDR